MRAVTTEPEATAVVHTLAKLFFRAVQFPESRTPGCSGRSKVTSTRSGPVPQTAEIGTGKLTGRVKVDNGRPEATVGTSDVDADEDPLGSHVGKGKRDGRR